MIRYQGQLYQIEPVRSAGLSQILYHRTSLHNLASILSSNSFRLSTSAGTGSDQTKGEKKRQYFLSTSRSLGSSVHGDVTIILDGGKLGQKYRGGPRDYWGPKWKTDEMEDYLVSSRPTISPALDYIKAIHIFWDRKWSPSPGYAHFHHKNLRDSVFIAKTHKIPIFVYDDENAYLVLNRKRALPFDQIPFKAPKEDLAPGYEWLKEKSPLFGGLIELYLKKPGDRLSQRAERTKRNLWSLEIIEISMNELHNFRDNPISDGIVSILQKAQMTVSELIKFLRTKWKRR